jgi:ketosteroid isomerase-like protein
MLAAAGLPASAAPDTGAKAVINAAVAATNTNDAAKIGSYFSSDAVIVDENAPCVWRGAGAGSAWWQSVQHEIAGGSLHATAGPLVEYRADNAANAYAVVPLHITVSMKGKTIHESGLWALTLHRFAGGWKITTASWATSQR